MDYIRYPYSNLPTYISNSSTTDLKDGGYTTYAMNEFLASIGRTGANLRELIKQIRYSPSMDRIPGKQNHRHG